MENFILCVANYENNHQDDVKLVHLMSIATIPERQKRNLAVPSINVTH